MKSIVLVSFVMVFSFSIGQTNTSTTQRKGFVFGTSIGVSSLQLTTSQSGRESQFVSSFPNFKIGTMVSSKTAIVVLLPGSLYKYKGVGRERDRGFEGIIPSVQYWVKDRFWVLGGVGLTLDAPAFYDIKDETERKFYFGPAMVLSSGYELWSKGKFAIDLQARMHYGYAAVPEGTKTGLALNFMIGFNWY